MIALPVKMMTGPLRGYRALAASGETPSIAIGAGRFLLVLGALVSFSATGRFAPLEALLAAVSFSWLPLVHAISIAVVVRVFRRNFGWRRAYAFYLQGIGPWLVIFIVFIGAIVLTPHPERPHLVLWTPLVAAAAVWSVVLSYALFRAGLDLPRGRAMAATALFWVSNHILILGYFLAVGQLWPIL